MKITAILIIALAMLLACSESPYQPASLSADNLEGYWVGQSKITYPGPDDGPISDSIVIFYEFQANGDFYYSEYSRFEATPPIVLYSGTFTIEGNTITLMLNDWEPAYSPLHVAGTLEATSDGNQLHLYQKEGEEFPTFRWVDIEKVGPLNPGDFYIFIR